jgi:hypothetical protein
LLWGGSSHADTDEGYVEVIQEAVREFRLGHWNEAVVLFQSAHSVSPNARTLRGMGVAAFEGRRYAEAIQWLSEALSHPVRPLTPQLRSEVESVMRRAEKFVGSFVMEFEPAEATVTVNGREAIVVDGRLRLDPGTQRLMIRAEGYRQVSKKISVRGGHFGVDPLFFGLLVALNLQTAFLSPPVAMAAFYLKGVAPPGVTLNQIFAGMLPFMGIQVVAVILLYVFPQIGLWLPQVLYR